VLVRLTQINTVDLKHFDFDYDLTWFVFFLNTDETIYGRYGGRDAASAESRISLKGLRYAMDKALEFHDTKPKAVPKDDKPKRVTDFPASKKHRGCIHCHNAKEFERAEKTDNGTWNRDDLWVYPLPENIGLTLDVDVGNKVKSVKAKSAAESAGVKAGDFLTKIGETRVSSFADAIYGLHKAPKKGEIAITWERDGKSVTAKLMIEEGWRKTNITWRPSLLDILPSVAFSADELSVEERKQLGLDPKRAVFKQDKFVHSTLKAVGVQKDDVVIGFDGKSIEGKMKDLLGYLRQNYLAGDEVEINILRDGKPLNIKMKLK
jgi:serine protease Do